MSLYKINVYDKIMIKTYNNWENVEIKENFI